MARPFDAWLHIGEGRATARSAAPHKKKAKMTD